GRRWQQPRRSGVVARGSAELHTCKLFVSPGIGSVRAVGLCTDTRTHYPDQRKYPVLFRQDTAYAPPGLFHSTLRRQRYDAAAYEPGKPGAIEFRIPGQVAVIRYAA